MADRYNEHVNRSYLLVLSTLSNTYYFPHRRLHCVWNKYPDLLFRKNSQILFRRHFNPIDVVIPSSLDIPITRLIGLIIVRKRTNLL